MYHQLGTFKALFSKMFQREQPKQQIQEQPKQQPRQQRPPSRLSRRAATKKTRKNHSKIAEKPSQNDSFTTCSGIRLTAADAQNLVHDPASENAEKSPKKPSETEIFLDIDNPKEYYYMATLWI